MWPRLLNIGGSVVVFEKFEIGFRRHVKRLIIHRLRIVFVDSKERRLHAEPSLKVPYNGRHEVLAVLHADNMKVFPVGGVDLDYALSFAVREMVDTVVNRTTTLGCPS